MNGWSGKEAFGAAGSIVPLRRRNVRRGGMETTGWGRMSPPKPKRRRPFPVAAAQYDVWG